MIHGSPLTFLNALADRLLALQPQLATMNIRPSIRSAGTFFSTSGAPMCAPLAMTGTAPLAEAELVHLLQPELDVRDGGA